MSVRLGIDDYAFIAYIDCIAIILEFQMGSITIRNVDEEIKRGARLVAAGNGRSLEAELRDLLKRTYAPKPQDRGEWLRSLSGKEAIAHLIKVANGAGEGVFDEDEGNFREFDL